MKQSTRDVMAVRWTMVNRSRCSVNDLIID